MVDVYDFPSELESWAMLAEPNKSKKRRRQAMKPLIQKRPKRSVQLPSIHYYAKVNVNNYTTIRDFLKDQMPKFKGRYPFLKEFQLVGKIKEQWNRLRRNDIQKAKKVRRKQDKPIVPKVAKRVSWSDAKAVMIPPSPSPPSSPMPFRPSSPLPFRLLFPLRSPPPSPLPSSPQSPLPSRLSSPLKSPPSSPLPSPLSSPLPSPLWSPLPSPSAFPMESQSAFPMESPSPSPMKSPSPSPMASPSPSPMPSPAPYALPPPQLLSPAKPLPPLSQAQPSPPPSQAQILPPPTAKMSPPPCLAQPMKKVVHKAYSSDLVRVALRSLPENRPIANQRREIISKPLPPSPLPSPPPSPLPPSKLKAVHKAYTSDFVRIVLRSVPAKLREVISKPLLLTVRNRSSALELRFKTALIATPGRSDNVRACTTALALTQLTSLPRVEVRTSPIESSKCRPAQPEAWPRKKNTFIQKQKDRVGELLEENPNHRESLKTSNVLMDLFVEK